MKWKNPFAAPRPNKFGAKRVGEFASKKEANYAAKLDMEKLAGKILDYTWQFPIHLPGGRYVVDFLVLNLDGSVSLVETKGVWTPTFKRQVRVLEVLRPHLFARLKIV